jgi:ankyrin repeat protein
MRKLIYFFTLWFYCAGLYAQEIGVVTINGADYSFTDPSYELLMAAFEGDTNRLIAFIELGTDVNTTTFDGITPLMYAAQEGHLRAVEILLREGASVNMKPYNQIDALLGATIAGHVFVVDTLILNGANLNTRNMDGVTPLMYAAAFNDLLMADVLIFYGANINAADNFGNQAIHFSTFYNNLAITEMLHEQGADLDARDMYEFNPLMIAAQNGYPDLVTYLVENGAIVNSTNKFNATPLALAIVNRHFQVIEYLVAQGAEPDHRISDKAGLADLAYIYGDHQTRELFRGIGFTPKKNLKSAQIFVLTTITGNLKDLMMGGEMGFHELKTGLTYSMGYMTRPTVRSVLYETAPDTMFQYWERRSLFHLGADKFFNVHTESAGEQWGGFAGLHAAYSYGNFRGADKKPDTRLHPLIRAGLYYTYRPLHLRLNYEYLKFRPSKASPHRVSLSVGMALGLKRYRIFIKNEPRV